MAQTSTSAVIPQSPLRSPIAIVIAAWLVPGAGHFLLGKRNRGAILLACVVISFAIGLLLRGPMFEAKSTGDTLTSLIQIGGFLGDMAAGLIYFVTVWSGYAQPDMAGHTHDYGSKFLVAAGLLNVLGIVDAWEIATKKKD